jgi:predicted DNA-binding transcriptional regulator AlpA
LAADLAAGCRTGIARADLTRTNRSMASNPALTQVDTRDVVFTIQHVAALFHVKVDSAREYTYRQDFPPAHQLGARLLWDRDEILAWFRSLPRLTLADRRRGESVVAVEAVVAPRAARTSQYRRRPGRGSIKAAT